MGFSLLFETTCTQDHFLGTIQEFFFHEKKAEHEIRSSLIKQRP